jgi:cysteine synthase A
MSGPTVLDAIGNTPLVELRRVVPKGHARILVKLESANPTGTMKDRMALASVKGAVNRGLLPPDGTVVEYTGGSTGVSLAFVCSALGYPIKIVSSDAFSEEKRRTMRAYGAELEEIPSDNGNITRELIQSMIERARQISDQPKHWWVDQLSNTDAASGYHSLGEEIWRQTSGRVDAFVQSVGTAHSLHGTTEVLRKYNPALQVIAVEPSESPVLSRNERGAHQIEGIGIGFVPPLWDPGKVDEIMTGNTAESKAMARTLAKVEALFSGTSSGLNVIAALRVAERLGPEATVVTLMIDAGLKYMSTDVYR